MNREIKFRCYEADGVMIEDIHVLDENGNREGILMQYTGLKDKNGVEIYEGDIIDIHQTVNGQSLFLVASCLPFMDVRYAYNSDLAYEYSIEELLDAYANQEDKEIEVVGNIYDNPELLGQNNV